MEVNLCNSSYSSQSFTPILKCDFLSDLLQTCVNPILWNRLGLPPQSSASGNAELAPLAFAQLRARIFLFAPRWARGGRKLSVICRQKVIQVIYTNISKRFLSIKSFNRKYVWKQWCTILSYIHSICLTRDGLQGTTLATS